VSTAYEYDGLNRVRTKTLSSGGLWVYTYDVGTNYKGRMVSEVLQGSTDGYYYDGYDAAGRVTSSHQITTAAGAAQSYSMSYKYDLAGNLTSTRSTGWCQACKSAIRFASPTLPPRRLSKPVLE